MLGERVQLGGLEESFEEQDRPRFALLAQPHRGIDLDQRESVGGAERGQDTRQSMAVRIGLDDGENARPGRACAGTRDVAGKRVEIELRDERPGHGKGSASGRRCYAAQGAPVRRGSVPKAGVIVV
jgi:hypothetical protein